MAERTTGDVRRQVVAGAGRGLAGTVRGRRLALRLTQRQAAVRAEVSLATWQSVERAGAEASAFQDLTLARVAHGLGVDLTTLLAEAAGDAPSDGGADASAGSNGATPSLDVARDPEVEALVADVSEALRRLSSVSEPTFHLVAGQALEAADRFLQVLED